MGYSRLSDQEINIQVARIMHPEREVIESKSRPPSACVIGRLPSKWLDYCNNPADAWSIITEAKISLLNVKCGDGSELWLAKGKSCPSRGDANPLRAAMIVFLMMEDNNHA